MISRRWRGSRGASRHAGGVRILLITPMWPSARDPDFGAFLVPHVEALRELGHEVDVVAIEHRGGTRLKYAGLAARSAASALRRRPDVVAAHTLFPAGVAGVAAATVARAPLMVMAHGQDVVNLANHRVRRATERVLRRADGVVTNSEWLAERLRAAVPGIETTSISLGVDTDAFSLAATAPTPWPGDHPRLLCVGSLTERKNVVALADAFAELGTGSLVFVGDGALRPALGSRPGVTVIGRIEHSCVPSWMAACDVLCQPSVAEPFGLAALEAMALGRTVLASANGGPAEFVPPEAGVLVDATDPDALLAGLRAAIAVGSPNAAARAAAVDRSAAREAARFAELLAAVVTR